MVKSVRLNWEATSVLGKKSLGVGLQNNVTSCQSKSGTI